MLDDVMRPCLSVLAIGFSMAQPGCVKKYVEIRVHQPGKVGLGAPTAAGPVPVLPPFGADASVPLSPEIPGVLAVRHGGPISVTWTGEPPGLPIVDAYGRLPSMPSPHHGLEIREGSLWASYNLTANRILPERDRPVGSVPIVLGTSLDNVAEAREIREPRRWPMYVCLPLGALFAVVGGALLSTQEGSGKFAGGVYLGAAIPLLTYGIINATASTSAVPLELPARSGP